MKHFFVSLCICCFSMLALAQDSWELKKNRNGVSIYTRDYPNSKFKEYKAVMTANTTLNIAKDIILDAGHLKDWNYKTSKSRMIKRIDENYYILYLFNDMPWPVLNRDHVSDVITTYPTKKSVLISITPNNNVLPENDDVVRITNFKGFWLLEKTYEGISITHQLFGDPEGGVPAWLVNSQLVKSPYSSFRNLEELLENKQN